jgi:LysR family transcriptional regulator, glycine cleavage system transcriptional activator
MQKYKILDGVLGALPVFESAARYLSFTKAAEELFISQSAVSRRITNIEDSLNIRVFKRNHNKLELTPQGKELLSVVEVGLGHLGKGINQIQSQSKKENLVISCGHSFASLWLQHRIADFRNTFNEVDVQLILSDLPDELDQDTIDVRIVWSEDYWPEREKRALIPEDVFPVCSFSFLKKHLLSELDCPPIGKLREMKLLHCYSENNSNYLDWTGWFGYHGLDYLPSDKDYFYDKYYFAVQAAVKGEGIALGFSSILDNFLANKELVRIGPTVHNQDEALFIEFASNRILENKIQKIYDWFRDQIRNN